QIGMEFAALNGGANLRVLPSGGPAPARAPAAAPLPDLQGLFQIGGDCAFEDCRSRTRPAASLSDPRFFLENRSGGGRRHAQDVLLARRPDLIWIDLDCDNALTELPYVDLCCEVLEDAVAPFIATILAPVAAGDMPGATATTISTNFRD